MKRVFIVHGWASSPQDAWLPWIKKELEKKGFEVTVPAMPNPLIPVIEKWTGHLRGVAGQVDEQTFFIGHSIGCQTILRFIESLPAGSKIGGAVFVAGWFTLKGLADAAERLLAKPWLETPMDFEKIKSIAPRITAIFSDNDYFVPLDNVEFFKQRLNAKTTVEQGKGHFARTDKIFELPEAVEEMMKMTNL
jgi:uncharacterized protein